MRIAMATSLVAIAALTATSVSSASSAHATAPAARTATLKIGLVTDIGGLNDRSFNHLAYLGVTEAQKKLGVQIKVLQSKSGSDYIPYLSTLAAQHYDLVIAVGFLMGAAVKAVSAQFPSTKFAIIDVDNPSAGGGKNVEGLTFHEEESGYVAGYLAGLMQKVKGPRNNGKNVVSTVGGVKIPPVDHYIAGFIAGSKAADPTVTELNGYSNSFTDAAKCKSLAQTQLAKGSDVVFAVAGGCGLGALSAANSKGVWGVGVDADQNYLGPYMLTSAVKKVDFAVYATISKLKQGTFAGGQTTTFGIKNFAAGISGYASTVPSSVKTKVNAIIAKIKAGGIKIPNTVK
ncbi:MAG: BMP family ABC transporter substrate-binding protein [Gaiellales bacterium]